MCIASKTLKAVPLYLSENNDDIDQLFMEGKLSMTLNTYMSLNGWNEMGVEYDISPVPYLTLNPEHSILHAAGGSPMSFAVPSGTTPDMNRKA